jgi:hypothetical protein
MFSQVTLGDRLDTTDCKIELYRPKLMHGSFAVAGGRPEASVVITRG